MPRFHFHIEHGESSRDEDGMELPDIAAAKALAVRYFRDSLDGIPDTFWTGGECRMYVADESGLTLFSLHFVGIEAPALSSQRHPEMITAEAKGA